MEKKPDIRFTLYIPPVFHKKLTEWAKENHRSLNQQILVTLEEVLREKAQSNKGSES